MTGQYADCDSCATRRGVRDDGLFRLHRNTRDGGTCEGSHKRAHDTAPVAPVARRWLVERARDVFEDIGAETVEVHASGALEFYDGEPWDKTNYIVLAPGQWITVCEAAA